MKNIHEQIQSTIQFYDVNADNLYSNYENAEMLPLYKLLLANIGSKGKVLDIGFGSARDLAFLQSKGFDIWGIEPSDKFVKKAKHRFQNIEHHFIRGSLPSLNAPVSFYRSFDAVILIAVWMHLPREIYKDTVKEICSLLRQNAKVIISYSTTARIGETKRHFEEVDSRYLKELFQSNGCIKINDFVNSDGLGDREITWKTEVYQYDKS